MESPKIEITEERRKELIEYKNLTDNIKNKQESYVDFLCIFISILLLFSSIFIIYNNKFQLNCIFILYMYILFSILTIFSVIFSMMRCIHISKNISLAVVDTLKKGYETLPMIIEIYLNNRKFPISKFYLDRIVTFNNLSVLLLFISLSLFGAFICMNI